MQAEYYDEEDLGKTITTSDIDESQLDEAKEWRSRMVEAICETDDTLAEKFLLEEEITVGGAETRVCERATIATEIIPVTCGASYKNKGVQLLLDRDGRLFAFTGRYSGLSSGSTRRRRRK